MTYVLPTEVILRRLQIAEGKSVKLEFDQSIGWPCGLPTEDHDKSDQPDIRSVRANVDWVDGIDEGGLVNHLAFEDDEIDRLELPEDKTRNFSAELQTVGDLVGGFIDGRVEWKYPPKFAVPKRMKSMSGPPTTEYDRIATLLNIEWPDSYHRDFEEEAKSTYEGLTSADEKGEGIELEFTRGVIVPLEDMDHSGMMEEHSVLKGEVSNVDNSGDTWSADFDIYPNQIEEENRIELADYEVRLVSQSDLIGPDAIIELPEEDKKCRLGTVARVASD